MSDSNNGQITTDSAPLRTVADAKAEWFVMYKRVPYEVVEQRLQEEHIECFVPRNLKIIKSRHGGTVRKEPIMTPYIFVHATHVEIQDFKRRNDMLQFIPSRSSARHSTMRVSDAEMMSFIKVCEANVNRTIVHSLEDIHLKEGAKVKIVGGQMDQVKGIVTTVNGYKRKRLVVGLGNFIIVSAPLSSDVTYIES